MQTESNIDDTEPNSTQPASISGEEELHVTIPCEPNQMADVDAKMFMPQHEISGIQEENFEVTSYENVGSFGSNSVFEPKGKSTPLNEQKTKMMGNVKGKLLAPIPMRAVRYIFLNNFLRMPQQ